MKINFRKFPVYTAINKESVIQQDISFVISNGIYSNVPGIQAHALALKIYNASDEVEMDDAEIDLIVRCMELFVGIIADSVKDYITKKKTINGL